MQKASRVIVFKIGGEILRNPELLTQAMLEIATIKKREPKANLILVHGAGPQLDERFKQAKVPVEKMHGKRVTTKEGMQVIWNFVPEESRQLVKIGIKSESIDFSLTTLAKIGNKELGFVGTPIGVNVRNLTRVLRRGGVPIVSICGVTKQGRIVNVNADDVAAGIAAAMKADLLELKTNTPGVLNNGRTIGRISVRKANELIKNGTVQGGMLVKLRAAQRAVGHGVKQARISGFGQNRKGTTLKARRR